MPRTEKLSKGAFHAADFFASPHFWVSRLRLCSPCILSGRTKEGRTAASTYARRIATCHEGRSREGARHRSRCGVGFAWPIVVVRRNRQSELITEPRYYLQHRISSRVYQQNVCGAGAFETAGRRKNQLVFALAGCRSGNSLEKPLGEHQPRACCESFG